MNKRVVVTGMSQADKDKELDTIAEMLTLPTDAFQCKELREMNPEGWRNVGMSIVDAVVLLKESQLQANRNLQHIKEFLDKFMVKTLSFVRSADVEIIDIKKKSQVELQKLERSFDEKIKA